MQIISHALHSYSIGVHKHKHSHGLDSNRFDLENSYFYKHILCMIADNIGLNNMCNIIGMIAVVMSMKWKPCN